jgi:uncharacterized damage-inducible protein DinB
MKKLLCCMLLVGLTAVSASAQGGQPASETSKDPLATYLRNQFRTINGYLVRSVEMMPEENFDMRLGTQPEVRTFGQLLGHVVNTNYMFCAMAKGEKNPNATSFEKTPQTKASLLAGMKAATEYCQPAYDALTDSAAVAMVTRTVRGNATQVLGADPLLRNLFHNNEEYGNLVGYFRAKNIVPPSTAARAGN